MGLDAGQDWPRRLGRYLIFMLYIISITLSLLGGFVAGLLVARKHADRLKASEAEGRKLLDALKGK